MIFEITVQSNQSDSENTRKSIRIKANDWFTAMREGLPKMGIAPFTQEIEVTLLEDECSAVVVDAHTATKIHVLALKEEVKITQTPNAPPDEFASRAHIRFDSQPVPVLPSMKPDTFSLNGAYVKGTTTDFLTEAFMKVGDMYGSFGNDLQAAMDHLFAMLEKATRSEGGGLLLADINDPQGRLTFVYAMGSQQTQLLHTQVPGDRGAIGECCQRHTPINMENHTDDPRFPDDPLTALNLHPGPMLCIPINHQQQNLGAMLLYRPAQAAPYAQAEVNLFAYLSDAIGKYLHLRAQQLDATPLSP